LTRAVSLSLLALVFASLIYASENHADRVEDLPVVWKAVRALSVGALVFTMLALVPVTLDACCERNPESPPS
jgi:hypothetical protein